MNEHILIVDDDGEQRSRLKDMLAKFGYDADTVAGGEEAIDLLTNSTEKKYALLILDMVMPGLDGMGVLDGLRRTATPVPIIVQIEPNHLDLVAGALRAGACDFATKPTVSERLKTCVQNALKLTALQREVIRTRRAVDGVLTFENLVTGSQAMAQILPLGMKAAQSDLPILLEGEPGVGKEVIARAIHGSSSRRSSAFASVNCRTSPEKQLEAILFGSKVDSSTGVNQKQNVKHPVTKGDTLFLDEIGELSPKLQEKLFSMLQEETFSADQVLQSHKLPFRIITASNYSLLDRVKTGKFQEGLFYRLNLHPIRIPPLRDRPEDIEGLTRNFIARFAAEEGRGHVVSISPDALAMLKGFHWPGNVRQLENAVFRAVIMAENNFLTTNEFPQICEAAGWEIVTERPDNGKMDLAKISRKEAMQANTANHSFAQGEPDGLFGFIRILDASGQVRAMEQIEKDIIDFAIDFYGDRFSETARRLAIGRSTLYRKIKAYELGAATLFEAAE